MSFGPESPSWNLPPRVDDQRLTEDSKILQNRRDFKREHGQEAGRLVAYSELFKLLYELSRRQKRAFYRAATDFAVVELFGLTHFEESDRPANTTIDRNRERFEQTEYIDYQID